MRDRLLPFFAWTLSTRRLHRLLFLPNSNRFLVALLRHFGARVGSGSRVYPPILLINAGKDFSNLSIGENVYLGHGATLDLKAPVTIGDDVTIASHITISTHVNVGNIPLQEHFPSRSERIRIHRNVYIGSNVVVLAGVSVGEGSVGGAGAVVVIDVDPGTVVAGVPARPIRKVDPSREP
ncbi:MAG: acyltransferase [Deltaproteobacteria bacterium]|nr:acyltransferase [Deltaproteobacteria bacterium]